ncbi:hypothetical protein QCA50_017937 [Cerrena zonata]|uniref:F-box domain-containing protein n=1 Tax=Cerrena zonata TaxID=2478898 RepID=A0AAW0FJ56_9APHY
MQREIPLPNEIIDMIIDELCDYRKTLKLCALINSHWLGRTRVYLFKTLYIEGHKRGKTLVLRRTPERLEKEVSPLARNSVKRLVLNNRVGIYDIKDDQVCMNANLVLYFLMLLPNVDHLALSASHLGRPDTGRRLIHKPERQRHLKCLEISDIRVGADSDNVSDDNVSDSSSSDNGFDYEGSALHNFLSLFSEIDMMFLLSTSVSSEGTIGRSYIRSLPVIHRLTLGDYVEDAWVFGVFCGYEPSRLRSLTELHLRIWPESQI